MPLPRPDLAVQSPSVDDATLHTGATFTLSATVANSGDWQSNGTTLRYYRSTDATITTADTEVGTDVVDGLLYPPHGGQWAKSSESIDLTAPSTVGTYYYGACVDSVTGESDTTNNCSSSVTVTVPENSSAIGAPTISGTAQVGQTLTADTSGISDADGLTNVSYSYQWLSSRDTEIGDTEIDGATRFHLHGPGIRQRQGHQGAGHLHRRRGQRGDADQRGNVGGGIGRVVEGEPNGAVCQALEFPKPKPASSIGIDRSRHLPPGWLRRLRAVSHGGRGDST